MFIQWVTEMTDAWRDVFVGLVTDNFKVDVLFMYRHSLLMP